MFGCGKTQIQNILKRKAEVLEDIANNELSLKWLLDVLERRLEVNGPMLQKQALKFAVIFFQTC